MTFQELYLGGTEASLAGAASDHAVDRMPRHRVRPDPPARVDPGEQRPVRIDRFRQVRPPATVLLLNLPVFSPGMAAVRLPGSTVIPARRRSSGCVVSQA
jgi:hypothetical protein